MIEIRNLCKSFEGKIIYENFNLTIEDNSFIALTGPSGCGKTTLINMIGAIERVDSGEILVDGTDIQKKKNQLDYFRNKVGFLFQNFALVENKTVAENLSIVKKASRSEVSIEKALEYVNMSDKLNQKIYKLSGGEQQRIALARLMIKKCDVVLADEPTGSLDKKNAGIVIDILKKINEMGKTVIIVTHDPKVAERCDRIIEISDGEILSE